MDDIEKMEHLLAMVETAGWLMVQEFIEARLEDCKAQLVNCPLSEVIPLRKKIEAYVSIFNYINGVIIEGQEAQTNQIV